MHIFNKLLNAFGPQNWWPIKGEYRQRKLSEADRLEVCIGAILTQNTSWKNVEQALDNLHKYDLMDLKKLASIDEKKLANLIRCSGYYRQKAKKLKIFAQCILESGSLKDFFEKKNLRDELLSVWGIGPETADSIMLYAAEKPIFVIDAYTKRIMSRFGVCKSDVDYHVLQGYFHKKLEKNHKLFNEYHALFVEIAKRNCKKVPECQTCPLKKDCDFAT
ncbi:MAG: endonuclease III domain-containing protein [Candidatus Woesearchaeota archaeon]|nr:endonuclease III domain-containing protein [Candidatus Woesearchaeota archaeon]